MPVGTVAVACKLPNGLFLDVEGMQRVHITGFAHALDGSSPRNPIAGGYSITFGVPADFWERWLSENENYEPVKKGLIFAHEKPAEVNAKAKDQKVFRSGIEPLNADDPANGVQTDTDVHRPGTSAAIGAGNQRTVRVGNSPAIDIR